MRIILIPLGFLIILVGAVLWFSFVDGIFESTGWVKKLGLQQFIRFSAAVWLVFSGGYVFFKGWR